MVILRYNEDNKPTHVLCPRYQLNYMPNSGNGKIDDPDDGYMLPNSSHLEILKTVATARFEIQGDTAEDAVENNIDNCINIFIECLNRLLRAHLVFQFDAHRILTPYYDRGTFNYLYILIKGHGSDIISGQRIALNAFRNVITRGNYDPTQCDEYLRAVQGGSSQDDIMRILNSGKSYIEAGALEFALLQLVIAAEVLTARFVNRVLQHEGVSNTKLKEYQKEMTFSRMLNIDIFGLCPQDMKPDRKIIGTIDWARRLRNKVMHEGVFSASRQELRKLYETVNTYRDFLEEVLVTKGLSKISIALTTEIDQSQKT
jgi:hypothetical protein